MGLLGRLRRRRAIRSYVRELPRLLQRDYGAARWFSMQQVTRTVERAELSREYLPYALLMFSDPAAFERHRQQTGETLDVEMMRRDLGPARFYDTREAANLIRPTPWSEAPFDSQPVDQSSSDGT